MVERKTKRVRFRHHNVDDIDHDYYLKLMFVIQ